jgi:hypothetical protein
MAQAVESRSFLMPHEVGQTVFGFPVPDPITFVVGEEYLHRNNLYPRQATLLKVIFLRDDLFTDYDNAVIDEWTESYRTTGYNGIVPDVRERIKILKALGHPWFREVLLVMGRRAGKGHISGLAMAYILWCYLAKGDPQEHYGIDRDKKLSAMVFAGKREQAKATVWRDLVNVVIGSKCFQPYIHMPVLGEKLSIYSPHDRKRKAELARKNISVALDLATFEIVPKESTLMAGRGPTSFMQAYDEMAHVVNSGANRSAEEVYQAATPSLDQFGKDAFIIEPSSPWQMMGQFYDNYQQAIEVNELDGTPEYPEKLMIQLASWDIYKDWERAYALDLFPEGFTGDKFEYWTNPEEEPDGVSKFVKPHPRFKRLKGAIQTYDAQMERLKKANPDTFKVERESRFATALDAYLNEQKVMEIFQPWRDRPEHYGPPEIRMQEGGLLTISYKGHADPSKVNDKFGVAVAHAEYDAEGRAHCVFDLLTHFDPADFEGGIIDYEYVDDWLWDNVIMKFYPEEFTFDQYNSTSSIQKLQKRIRNRRSLPKTPSVFEKTTTRQYDWQVKENSKAAINLGLVHAPYYERAELELRFLQLVNNRVDHPSSGPVQSKDVADAMTECIHVLIGEQVNNFVHGDMSGLRPGMTQQGGSDPFPGMRPSNESEALEAMSGFGRARGSRPDSPPGMGGLGGRRNRRSTWRG